MSMDTFFIPNPEAPWVHATNGDLVKVHSVGYVNGDLSGGNIGIYVTAIRKKVQVVYPFDLLLPGSVDHFATYPQLKIDMAGGGFDPKNARGPFTIKMGDAVVDGMGLPLNQHVIYWVTFALVP